MSLVDINHYFGSDISTSATGDMAQASGTTRGTQRVLRRLLTNPGDYIFHPEYGAGLARYIGAILNIEEIKALIIGQMALEESVSQFPEPDVRITSIQGGISVYIRYTDKESSSQATLSFNVNI